MNMTYWLTGLSGSGKSTIAKLLKERLQEKVVILDGDELRKGLNFDLNFSTKDRTENIRRVAEVAKLLNHNEITVITALISPLTSDRLLAKSIIGGTSFKEIYVDAPLKTCEKRDVKGLYSRARNGEILDFTGISSPYEIPINPDFIVPTENTSIKLAINQLENQIKNDQQLERNK